MTFDLDLYLQGHSTLTSSCPLCNVFSSRSIIFILGIQYGSIVWVIMRRRGVSTERRRSSCSSCYWPISQIPQCIRQKNSTNRNVHMCAFSVTKWYIVAYEDSVLWDLCNRSIVASWYHTSAELVTSFVRLGPDGTSVMFQMLCSMKQQFAVLLSDIGFISEGLTTRAMERHGRYGTDGVAAVTGAEVCIMASWDWGELVNTLGLKKMATIFQTIFSNTFSWMKIYEFWLRFHWSLFVRVQLTTFQHCVTQLQLIKKSFNSLIHRNVKEWQAMQCIFMFLKINQQVESWCCSSWFQVSGVDLLLHCLHIKFTSASHFIAQFLSMAELNLSQWEKTLHV